MVTRWRWDQGRLGYFQYENLKAIAHVLRELEGIVINQKGIDPTERKVGEKYWVAFRAKHIYSMAKLQESL